MQYSLLFHCNNGFTNSPQCYVVRKLPVLLLITCISAFQYEELLEEYKSARMLILLKLETVTAKDDPISFVTWNFIVCLSFKNTVPGVWSLSYENIRDRNLSHLLAVKTSYLFLAFEQ